MITAQPDALKMFYQLLQGRILSYGHILIRSENKDKPSVKEVSIIPPSKRRSKIHPVLDQWAMNPEFKDQAIIVCRHYTNLLGWYRYGDILMAKLIG
jgi:hypothetical protein